MMILKRELKLIIVLSVIFVGLCSLHYFTRRPYWLDESFVIKNLFKPGYLRYFGVLDPLQSFPRLHLILIKFISAPYGFDYMATRLLSYVFMLSAYFVWGRLYWKNSVNRWLAVLSLLAITALFKFSYYASELKPYSMDMLAVALYTLYLQRQKRFDSPQIRAQLKDYVIVATLPLLTFFSYASLFVLWTVSYNFILLLKRNKNVRSLLILNSIVSIVSFIIFYFIDLRYSITDAGKNYWSSYFLCSDSFLCFMDTFGEGVKRLVVFWVGESDTMKVVASGLIPIFIFSLFGYGPKQWWRDRFRLFHIDTLSFVLFLELFVLGILNLYPFTGERLTLFYAPFVFHMVSKGIDALKKFAWCYWPLLYYYVIYYLICMIRTFSSHFQVYRHFHGSVF